ncbi:probetacellulin isoform X3 [Homo sapiens]|uniref:probetacellulin isoform X3 n=1 Tax=Homo sapiens TaxID=9606 RepID=UPI0007DC834F|nr:probetacellulin isoform X3 [Homo sapiens]|eukprot:XP_016864057.1 probetacellulin isoform X2 [Homo sapiens]
MDRAARCSGASSLPLLLALALGLVILHCVVADGNSTRSPETNGLLCGDPEENCAGVISDLKKRKQNTDQLKKWGAVEKSLLYSLETSMNWEYDDLVQTAPFLAPSGSCNRARNTLSKSS